MKSVKFVAIRFNDRYGRYPAVKAFSTAKTELIDLLHKNGVLWLGVEAHLFYGFKTSHTEINSKFPAYSNHAIALVGYQTQGDVFLIKDSNRPGLIKMAANKLLPCVNEAYAIKK